MLLSDGRCTLAFKTLIVWFEFLEQMTGELVCLVTAHLTATTRNGQATVQGQDGTAERPRLAVYRSNNNIYAQVTYFGTAELLMSTSTKHESHEGEHDIKALLARCSNMIPSTRG